MILVPAIPFGLVLAMGYYHFSDSLRATTVARMVRVVEDHRELIQVFLAERRADLLFVAQTYTFDDLKTDQALARVLDRLKTKSPAFVDLGVFDRSGLQVAYQGPYQLAGKAYGQTEWFKEVLRRGYYISNVFLGYRGVPHFIIALVREEEGERWVVRATIDSHYFTNLVERVSIGKTGEAYVLNAQGVFQTRRRSGGELLEEDPAKPKELSPHQGIRTYLNRDPSGRDLFYATAWINDNNWILVVRQDEADAFASLRSLTGLVILVSLLGGILIVGLAFYMTNSIIRRLREIEAEKSQLSQQLIVAGRLAEIGEMSAGFAHEINNPLQIIKAEQTLVETIMEELREKGELSQGEEVRELTDSLHQIKVQVDRCGSITQALLKFARQREPSVQEFDLAGFLPEVVGMVRKKAEVEGIGLLLETAGDCPPVKADPGQLQQVLVNLLNNAIDAVAQKRPQEGGRVEVKVGPAGREVEIRVEDNGTGISPENMDKIFTPFFTTKPVGQGTGLGLPVCFGIIDKMGGKIRVSSQEGEGATFTVLLPAAGLRVGADGWRGPGRRPVPNGGEDGQGQNNARG